MLSSGPPGLESRSHGDLLAGQVRALRQAGSISEAFQLYQRNRIERTTRIVQQSFTNRTLFHLRSVAEIRNAFANRDEGADRNNWLYSYNPLTVDLI